MNNSLPESQRCKYDIFFQNVECVREKQNKQKSRGLNDYNIFTSLLKASDEVRLHSRFIFSLLNPEGEHYQGTLFLEKFIEVIGLADFGIDVHQASVYVEYENIDLYITDGEKHIIIENKIWAEDQKCQIIRYINRVVDDHNDGVTETDTGLSHIDQDYIRVVYLTARNDKFEPKGHVVDAGYITADENYLKEGLNNYRAKYHRITYETEIMNWLDAAQYEVSNLSNLNLAIDQYREVILRLHRKYKGKVMTFEKYLFDTGSDEIDTIRMALTLEKDLVNIKGRTLYEFFNKLSAIEVAGKKGELYSDYKKEKEFGQSLCQGWVKRKKNGPRDFGVKWGLDGNVFVAVHAGISQLHVGISCKNEEIDVNCAGSELFGCSLKSRGWDSYPFSSYDLGKYEGIDLEILLGQRNKDIVGALEGLSQGI
jgi:hypothetical protein